jgi:4-nitrophenyl phosphatase
MAQHIEKIQLKINPHIIQALILDMDGVLWRGDEPIGDLKSIFEKINELDWKVVFATNNGSRTIVEYVELLASFGVMIEPWQVVSSATASIEYLRAKYPQGGPIYIIGERGMWEACESHGFYQCESEALSVIVGIDRELTYDKLKIATFLIHSGSVFIGTNPDKTFPTPQGLAPGAGAILAAIQASTGVNPIIIGKPQPAIYQIALQRLKLSPDKVLVVGDRPETDITGAQMIGCPTALVLSGVTDATQAQAWQPAPNIIAQDLESLVKLDWNHAS